MCRPPDLGPASAGLDDGFDPYSADGAEDWNEGNFESGDFDAIGSELGATSVLGKRDFLDESRLAEAVSRAAKLPRAAAPVSSAFDSAAASFVARMEQSMFQDAQRLQQKRLPGAAMEDPQQVLLQRALLEQQSKLQQLQQLQLLKQLQQQRQAELPVLPEQQQLLLAQQQLLQQSQSKLLNALKPSAAAVPNVAALLAKQQQQQNAESKLQALLNGGMAGASALMNPAATIAAAAAQSKPLPAIQPKPVNPMASAIAAKAGADFSTAAAMFGLGSFGQPAMRSAGLGFGEEKKAKRMQSNRASAKRSRQRRQARLEELDKSTAQLQAENATMCVKLEKAQGEILNLETKNRDLAQEVAKLRQLLGIEAAPLPKKMEAAPSETKGEVSGAGQLQSCVESGDHSSLKVADAAVNQPVVVKSEMESELAEDEYDDEVDGEDADDWLSALPLSPQGDGKFGLLSGDCPSPGLEQMLVQGDVFSELLACFDG